MVVICVAVLPGSHAMIVSMNNYSRFLSNGAIFVPHVIKKEWLNTAKGCLPMG
jgi:hypothetical protein